MTDLEQTVDDAVAAHRATSGCYCADTRTACEYHSGMAEGAELAMRTIYDALAAKN
jgi:hypothetical protein